MVWQKYVKGKSARTLLLMKRSVPVHIIVPGMVCVVPVLNTIERMGAYQPV